MTEKLLWLSIVNNIMESDSALSTTLRSLTQRCQRHCGVWLSVVNDIEESDSEVTLINGVLWDTAETEQFFVLTSVVIFKGIIRKKVSGDQLLY